MRTVKNNDKENIYVYYSPLLAWYEMPYSVEFGEEYPFSCTYRLCFTYWGAKRAARRLEKKLNNLDNLTEK